MILVEYEKCPKIAQNVSKIDKNSGTFHKKWHISIQTRQSKHGGFCIYIFDNSLDQSKSMVRLVRAEKMVLSGLVFARKIARMILI